MPCIPIKDGIICCSAGPYDFEGYLFTVHSYFGPQHICKTDWGIRVVQSNKFFDAVERWQKLPKKEREKYRVE